MSTMSRPSPLVLARAFYTHPDIFDARKRGDRAAARLALLCARVLAWHSPACPRRHVHAALVAEIEGLPGLSDAARAAALDIAAAAFCPTPIINPTDTPNEKEPAPCHATT